MQMNYNYSDGPEWKGGVMKKSNLSDCNLALTFSDKNQRLIAQIAIWEAIGLIISQPQRSLVFGFS